MAISKLFQNDHYKAYYIKWVADTREDAKKIKVTPSNIGSEIFIIESQKGYILDSKGIWHSKTIGDGDSIICDCVEESTIWETLPEE